MTGDADTTPTSPGDGAAVPSTGAAEPTKRGRLTRQAIGVRVFSSASDATRSRRPTDAILLVLAILGALVLSLYAPGPTAIDTAATDLVAQLPDLAGWFWEVTYDLLIVWSLVLLVVILFARGRKRLFLYEVVAVGFATGFAILAGNASGTQVSTSLSGILNSESPPIYLAMRVATRDRGDRDGVAGSVEADAAGRPMADRHRRGLRDRARRPRCRSGSQPGS